ncbi:MAG TPA: GNAT family N-acetyltransferase [Acidimicrobiales bacterium]|jgi:ribosomal protein S18 acetylase RimI-like enzyme|nr:GNAT family N-acetyltransferase [Acidimicrobiales bacterium]
MSVPTADVLRWGHERARTGPWRGDRHVAYLAPLPNSPLPSSEFVKRCLAILADRGFARVVTGALLPAEQGGFLAAGFAVEQRLHLLGVDLRPPLPAVPDGLVLRRGGRSRHADILAVDRAAFSTFWRFDARTLLDAISATPHTRVRTAIGDQGHVIGYAICGRAVRRGFVQRLAVDPAGQGTGTGRRLLLDGLHWLRRRGARRALVNTQVGNDVALALYLAAGFREEPSGLSVLSAGLR